MCNKFILSKNVSFWNVLFHNIYIFFQKYLCTNTGLLSNMGQIFVCMYSRRHRWNSCVRVNVFFSPHLPAGRHVAACLTAHCACPRHLPWLLDVGGERVSEREEKILMGIRDRLEESKFEAFSRVTWTMQHKQMNPLRTFFFKVVITNYDKHLVW